MRSINNAFVWLTIGVAAALLLPVLAMDGMFMDGMLYSVVAHNQANGFGSFWFPRFNVFTVAGLETFHEHPPLVFSMQAVWFRIFGSGFWVERSYSLLTALVTGGLMVAIWRTWTADRSDLRRLAWFPILLWIIIPTVHWCVHNNMMENTMGMFTTAAVLFSVIGRDRHFWPMHVLGGIMVFLATMSKGVPGAFPLAAPFLIAMVCTGRFWRGMGASLLMLASTAVSYALVLTGPEARVAMEIYVRKRLLHRIAQDPTVEHRLATLEMLFTNLIGPLAIILLILLLSRRMARIEGDDLRRPALAMALIGIAGVFPLMLTMVQKSFYMSAALPVIALALASWGAPWLRDLLARLEVHAAVTRWVKWLGITVCVAAVIAAGVLFERPVRDADMLHDVRSIGATVPQWSVIGAPMDVWLEWNLQTYLMRHHVISVTERSEGREWYLDRKDEMTAGSNYEPVTMDMRSYRLYRNVE